MKRLINILFSLLSISYFTLCQAQVHHSYMFTNVGTLEEAQATTCRPCQGRQAIVGYSEGQTGTANDDYLLVYTQFNGLVSNTFTFPDLSSAIDFTIYEDAKIRVLHDQSTGICEGYIVAFTAKAETAAIAGLSQIEQAHLLRLDPSLNIVWHKVPYNNAYRTFMRDIEIDESTDEIVLLAEKSYGQAVIISKLDLATGLINSDTELTFNDGGVPNVYPSDIEINVGFNQQYALTGKTLFHSFVVFTSKALVLNRGAYYDIDADGSADEAIEGLVAADGDLFLVGARSNGPIGSAYSTGFVTRLQASGPPTQHGNILWTKEYVLPDTGNHFLDVEDLTVSSSLIIAGQVGIDPGTSLNSGKGKAFQLAIDYQGNVLWNRHYQTSTVSQGRLNDIEVNNASICGCGMRWDNPTSADYDLLVTQTDAIGVINTVCDTVSSAVDGNLVPIKTPLSLTTSNPSNSDFNLSIVYGLANLVSSICQAGTPATIRGRKWIDLDCDGTINGAETGAPGWTIELRDAGGFLLQSTVTDASGNYSFGVYVPGNYYITEDNQTGYDQTTPANGAPYFLNVALGSNYTNLDFGNCPCDDLIGYNPQPAWMNVNTPTDPYIRDIVSANGYVFALAEIVSGGTSSLFLFDNVTENWILKHTFSIPPAEFVIYDNKLFFSGSSPGYFLVSDIISLASPGPTFTSSILLTTVVDYEVMNGQLYACGYGTGANATIWTTGPGVPSFTATTFPAGYDLYQMGAVVQGGVDKLVVAGAFGTALSPPSNDIVIFDPLSTTITGMGDGIDGLLPAQFEYDIDIVALNNEVHIGGRFSNVRNVNNTNKYGIYDLSTSTWQSNTSVQGFGIYDIDKYQGHLFIIGLYGNIAGITAQNGVVYDGSTYYPLGNTNGNIVLYAENLAPDGSDKLFCISENSEEYAICGGSNCRAYLPDTTLCPGETFTFQPFLSFNTGTFFWDFGDGNTSTQKNPAHSYINIGSYTVTFTYDDGLGCSGTLSASVDVINDPSCNFIPDPNPWEKLYGNNETNYPVKVKRTPWNEMLVLGNIEISPGVSRGTLSKFDASTGTLIWHFEMDDDIAFTDIEFSLISREYLIVGSTPGRISGVDLDNLSAVVKVIDFGASYTVSLDNTFSQLGREYYEEITRHINPPAGLNGHDYFFTGAINYAVSSPPPPSYIDLHTVGCMNINRALNAGSWYESTSHSGDDEYQRGLFTLNNGTVVVVGNDAQNDGIVLGLDPLTGAQVFGYEVLDNIDYYHGIEMPYPDQIMVVGKQNSTNNALISIFSTATNTLEASWTFDWLDNFEEVFRDAYGNYYATAQSTDSGLAGIPMVIKFRVVQHPPVLGNHTLSVNWIKYIIDNDTLHGRAHLYVDEHTDFIYYADSRVDNPGTFGQRDNLVAIFDLDMTSSDCIYPFPDIPVTHSAPVNLITPTINPISFGNVMGPNPSSPLDYLCADICIPPCILDWTWSQDSCYNVSFIAQPNGTAPFIYDWDIDNDGFPDYTIPNPTHDYGGPGVYTVCLGVTDAAGDYCEECKTITITPDTEKPQISCPPNINLSVPACERGSIATWNPIIATDCGDTSVVNVSCSHNSGDFFPCGATKVTCIATDDEGMVDSCYFFVFVNCLCAYFTNLTLECDTLPDTYRFSADLINQTNSGMTCQPPIITASIPSQYSVSVNNMIQNSNGDYHIEGTFFTQFCPNPTGFGLNASLTCICADGLPVTCNTSAYFPAICCDSVYIAPQAVCASKDTGIVALSYWNTICNVSKINWYLQDAPCPPIPFGGIPFQSSLGYQDLQFNPSLLSGSDLCIYAELILDNDDKPCDTLLSEMAVITMCDDVSCSMSPDQVYCQTDGSPGVLPMPITLTAIIPECDYTIEWYDYLGNLIPGMTGMYTYQPPILSLPAGTTCGHDFTYTVVITGPCGPISCSSTIRLDNDNSPDGILSISNPSVPIGDSICLGDRLQVTYQPQCIDPSAVWSWETRGLDPLTPWAPLPGGSTIQTTYNSNQINTSTAYRIIKHNGVCPGDTIVANAIIRTPKEYFCSAEPLDSCRMTGIRLQAGLTPCNPGPSCSCDYTVNWYKDNVLIYSANETTSPSQFNYINATLNGNYGGIYTVEIIDNCCGGQVFTKSKEILPPPLLKISAPCYVCDPSTVSAFTGRVLNPPNGITPIYSWSEITPSGPVPISPGGSSRQLIVIGGGTWRLTATYPGGCVLSKDVTVHDCSNALSAARVIGNYGSLAFSQQYGLVLRAPGGAFFKMIWRPGGPLMTTPYSYTSGQSNTIVIEDADLLINQSNQGFLLKDHAGNEMPKIKLEQAQLVSTLNYTMVDGIEAIDSDLVFIDNNYGIVLRDEDGSIYRIKVDNAGEISVEKILD